MSDVGLCIWPFGVPGHQNIQKHRRHRNKALQTKMTFYDRYLFVVKLWILPTYLLTPWSRVLLEKLTGSAASQEIPCSFGTRRFITVLTSARHLSLSWVNSIQSPPPLPTSWRSILILSSHLRLGLPSGLFHSGAECSFLLLAASGHQNCIKCTNADVG